MTAQLADEPELVQAVAKIAAKLDAALARQVIDLCAACFDAGVANGLVSKVVPSLALTAALQSVRWIIDGPTVHLRFGPPDETFR